MATGVVLSQLVTDLKNEIGHSINPAHSFNQDATLKYVLKRTQEEIWMTYDWPDRMGYRTVPISAGVGTADYPADMGFVQLNTVWSLSGAQYTKLDYRITPEMLNQYNPANNARGWPVQAWEHDPDTEQMRLWPVPNQDGEILLWGQLDLAPLVANDDKCTVDGTSLVLHAAAEMLAREKQEDAQLKLSKARNFTRKLLSQQGSQKRKPFVLGGGVNPNEYQSRRGRELRPYFAPPSP